MLYLSQIVVREVVDKHILIFDCLILCRGYHCTYDNVYKMLMLPVIALRMQVSK